MATDAIPIRVMMDAAASFSDAPDATAVQLTLARHANTTNRTLP